MSSTKIAKGESGWRAVMATAEEQIRKAKVQISALRRTIEICEEKIASGEPWPGDSSASPLSDATQRPT